MILNNGEPMLTPEEVKHTLTGVIRLSKFDLRHGYCQVSLDGTSQSLALFHTHKGIYKLNCLFFGGKNASGQFQATMTKFWSGLKRVPFIADNIIDPGKDNTENWRNFPKRTKPMGIVLSQDKCSI